MSDTNKIKEEAKTPSRVAYGKTACKSEILQVASHLYSQYKETGAKSDLDCVIGAQRQAISMASSPEMTRDDGLELKKLGHYLWLRYEREKALPDLEEAIITLRTAIDATPDNHRSLPLIWHTLSGLLTDRYLRTSVSADLDEAIGINRQVLKNVDESDPAKAVLLDGLGIKLGYDYKSGFFDDKDIINEAIDAARRAVCLSSEDDPHRSGYLLNLATHLGHRYMMTTDLPTELCDDLRQCVKYFMQAMQHPQSPVAHRFKAAHAALPYCADLGDWGKAYEAVSLAISLLPKLVRRTVRAADKHFHLSQITGISTDAVAIALNAGKEPGQALRLLEQSRGLIEQSLEEARIDVSDLKRKHPELAEKFSALQRELETRISTPTGLAPGQVGSISLESTSQLRPGIDQDMENIIQAIRLQPGFENFLQPPSDTAIKEAAKEGPIVVVNISEFRCDAIIVQQGAIRHVPLPNLDTININTIQIAVRTDEFAEHHSVFNPLGSKTKYSSTMIEKRRQNEDKFSRDLQWGRGQPLDSPQVLEWLWDSMAEPIMVSLGFEYQPTAGDVIPPHIWWILTGSLSKFPIHAAGYHSLRCGKTVMDRAMSSYASTINSIINGRQRPITNTTTSSKALLVAMQITPGLPWLEQADEEVSKLETLCNTMHHDTVTLSSARKKDVMSQLLRCNIFHFSGHGYTDIQNPMNSYLALQDWKDDPLTVDDLMGLNLRKNNPFLGYLSACGTGRATDERVSDEGFHLINGCRLAGFRHVIGTLWEVQDKLCVDIAIATYEGIRDGQMTDESVCLGLHQVTKRLRDQWLDKTPVPVTEEDRGSLAEASNKMMMKVQSIMDQEVDIRDATREDRDLKLGDDDDEEMDESDAEENIISLPWVPYVHFGP